MWKKGQFQEVDKKVVRKPLVDDTGPFHDLSIKIFFLICSPVIKGGRTETSFLLPYDWSSDLELPENH